MLLKKKTHFAERVVDETPSPTLGRGPIFGRGASISKKGIDAHDSNNTTQSFN